MLMNHPELTKTNTQEPHQKGEKHAPLPYFLEINKSNNRKFRIPCVNEQIAKKVFQALPQSLLQIPSHGILKHQN